MVRQSSRSGDSAEARAIRAGTQTAESVTRCVTSFVEVVEFRVGGIGDVILEQREQPVMNLAARGFVGEVADFFGICPRVGQEDIRICVVGVDDLPVDPS